MENLQISVYSVYLKSQFLLTGDYLDGGVPANTAGCTKQEGLQDPRRGDCRSELDRT